MAIAVNNFASKEQLLAAVEALIRDTLSQPAERDYALMVSGGNTPLPVYAAIAAEPFAASPRAHLAFTDDRYLPVDSPDSNFGNARAMIDAVGLSGRTLHINPDLEIEACAADYDTALARFFDGGGRIPIALLGLGSDGHTCSLFNDTDLARAANCLAAPCYKAVPPHRVTVSPDLLARVEKVIFVVAGDDKAPMIAALIDNPESITAGKAVARCPSVALWCA